jgi:trimeric autotransporter adhesin
VKLRTCFVVSFVSVVVCLTVAQTAAPNSSPAATQVPRLIKFSGVAKDDTRNRPAGVVGVTFSLYKDEQGGSPLWVETQNVQIDATGHYTVMLGWASADGVPLSLFSSAEAHWISTQVSGQPEQPRVLLLSVPYALKAADAETLGGLPASAFVHSNSSGVSGKANPQASSAPAGTLPPAAVTGKGTKDFVPLWTGASSLGNSLIYQTGGKLGIGTKTPQATVDIASQSALGMQVTVLGSAAAIDGIATDPKAGTTGVYGQSSSPIGNGVYGLDNATKGGTGVIGQSNATSGKSYGVAGFAASTTTGASGVLGNETATSGQVHGVSGFASSTTSGAVGVIGFELATTGLVYGVSGGTNSTTTNAAGVNGFEGAATGQVFGVGGSTNSTTDYSAGVTGYEGATSGKVSGVAGGTASTTTGASGVTGNAGATTGNVYGVSGYTPSTAGVGVLGSAYASSGNTAGVVGSTVSPNGIGALGDSTSTSGGTGIQGQTESTSGGAAGIFVAHGGGGLLLSGLTGSNYVSKFAVDASGNGFYAGNLTVTGKLTKGSGSFKIDHPLDPANRYLSHSFVESPDMMNVYNGNITTDRHGMATVNLPDYFEALNRDFRYQLTVIGQFAQAIVAKKISGNRFVIRTSKPGVEVSWQVTGIRHDAYADRYRVPVEEDKAAGEQGYFLHPEVFGQPESKGIPMAAQKPAPVSRDVVADASRR